MSDDKSTAKVSCAEYQVSGPDTPRLTPDTSLPIVVNGRPSAVKTIALLLAAFGTRDLACSLRNRATQNFPPRKGHLIRTIVAAVMASLPPDQHAVRAVGHHFIRIFHESS